MNEFWNLDPIYKGFDDPAFEADMAALKNEVTAINAFAEKLPGMTALEGLTEGIALQEKFAELVGKLAGYASLRQAADTRDPNAGSHNSFAASILLFVISAPLKKRASSSIRPCSSRTETLE